MVLDIRHLDKIKFLLTPVTLDYYSICIDKVINRAIKFKKQKNNNIDKFLEI